VKTLLPVGLVAVVSCVGLGWWLGGESPAAVAGSTAGQDREVRPVVALNTAIASRSSTPLRWIPSDAERPDDAGALLRWVPSDAERADDRGASLTWTPRDAERVDDYGATLVWTATDAERDDDVGIVVRGSDHRA
jgi:hypothetical protein